MLEPDDANKPAAPDISTKAELALRIYRLKLIAFHYWWVVALCITVGLCIQGYRWSIQPPMYGSTSRMMVSGQLNINQSATYSEDFQNFYGTQVALMKSPVTVSQAIGRVKAMHPEAEVDPNASMGASQEPRTSIFNLQVIANNPVYAEMLLNAIMDTYLSNKKGRKEQTTNEAVTAITEEISHLDSEIKTDEQQLLDFQKENNVVFIEQQSNNAASYLVGLSNEMALLTKERDLLALGKETSNADESSKTVETTDSAAIQNAMAAIQEQQAKIDRLKIQRQDYSVYLKDMHPKMITLTETIDQEERFLAVLQSKNIAARQTHLEDLTLRITNLEKQIADWNKKSVDLNQRLVSYQQLKGKISRETNMYEQLASSFQNVNLNKSLDQTTVSVMDEATHGSLIPITLSSYLIWGAIGGGLLGIAIIYFLNRLDDTVHSPLEVEEHFSVPLAGQIPLALRHKSTKRVPLISETDDRHFLLESFRDIRSFILFRSSAGYTPKSVLISSAEPNEGKSTLAANIASIFALSGSRVLLIDGDMRRGILHTFFDVPASPGLSEYLEGKIDLPDAVQRTHLPTLDLIPRGKSPSRPGELLLSSYANHLFEESHTHYDMVLWDSVPILAADDASNICPKVDGIIFVVRANFSSIYSVRAALEVLSRVNSKVLGLVLNTAVLTPPGYYNKYRHREYYATTAKE